MSEITVRGKKLLNLREDGWNYMNLIVGKELTKGKKVARLSGLFLAEEIYDFFLEYHTGTVQMANFNGHSLEDMGSLNDIEFTDIVTRNRDKSFTHVLPLYLLQMDLGPGQTVVTRFEKNGHKTYEAAYHLEQLLSHGKKKNN